MAENKENIAKIKEIQQKYEEEFKKLAAKFYEDSGGIFLDSCNFGYSFGVAEHHRAEKCTARLSISLY